MVYLPVTIAPILAVIIVIVLTIGLFKGLASQRGPRIHRVILAWVIFYSALGLGYIAYGLANGAPGAVFSSMTYGLFPLAYALLIGAATTAQAWVNLLRTLVLGTAFIGIATFEYLLHVANWIPDRLYVDPHLITNIGFYDGYIQMQHYSLASLIFAVPFLITALIVYRDASCSILPRKIIWLALLLGMSVVLVAGRRALILVVAVTPLLIWFFFRQLPDQRRPFRQRQLWPALLGVTALLLVTEMYLSKTFNFSWEGVVQLVLSGFNPQAYQGAAERRDQLLALIHGWMLHPLFGSGLGSFSRAVVRSDRPWEYELQYVLMLFQTGLIGIILYASGIVWVYRMGIRVIRSGSSIGVHMVPTLVGATSVLIANAVEPYLQTFGQLWAFFLPIGLINWWLVARSDSSQQSSQHVSFIH